jgi:hypothetical protein
LDLLDKFRETHFHFWLFSYWLFDFDFEEKWHVSLIVWIVKTIGTSIVSRNNYGKCRIWKTGRKTRRNWKGIICEQGKEMICLFVYFIYREIFSQQFYHKRVLYCVCWLCKWSCLKLNWINLDLCVLFVCSVCFCLPLMCGCMYVCFWMCWGV